MGSETSCSCSGASLETQRLAGAVMMAVEMPLALGFGLWVFLRAVPRQRLSATTSGGQLGGG